MKVLLVVVICVSLVLSVVFSLKSFTGYLVSDIVNGGANFKAFLFLMIGILGSFLYLAKFRSK
jgi:Mn2+/Fe2+ NRAMP family transporter